MWTGWSPRSVAGAWERVPQHTRGQDVAAGRHGLSRSAFGALRVAPAGVGSGSPLALPRLAPALSVAGLPLRPSRGGPCFQTPSAPAGARVRVTASPSSQCRVAVCPGSRSCGRPFLSSLLCARPSLSDQRRGPRAHTAVRCASARPRVGRLAGPQPRPEGPSLPTGAPSLCLRWVTFPVTSVDTVSRFFPGGPPGSPDVPPSRQRLRMVVDFCCS